MNKRSKKNIIIITRPKRSEISIVIKPALKRQFKALAFIQEKSIKDYLTELIIREIEEKKVVGLDRNTLIFQSRPAGLEKTAAGLNE